MLTAEGPGINNITDCCRGQGLNIIFRMDARRPGLNIIFPIAAEGPDQD